MVCGVEVKEKKLLGKGESREEMAHVDVVFGLGLHFVEKDGKECMEEECHGYASMLNMVETNG